MESVRFSSVPHGSEEARAFLQKRIALFGRTLFILCLLLFLMVGLLNEVLLLEGWSSWSVSAWNPFHLATTVALATVWLVCRRGRRSLRVLGVIDVLGVLAASVGAVLLACPADPATHPERILMLVITNTLLARAVIIPSTKWRTLWVGVAASAIALIGTSLSRAMLVQTSSPISVGSFQVSIVLWSTVAVVISTVTSSVIYGLHQQVRKAIQLGQYVLEEELGQGGMGIVYRASHAMLRRPAALKLLLRDNGQERNVERFEREVRLTARLTHANTVTVFDYGQTPDGTFYYAMELIEGGTLASVVRAGGPLPPARVVHILAQVAGSLAEAHAIGLIHRDIKPSNIMLCEQGGVPDVAKVLDFGLVKEIERDSLGLTAENEIPGTPQYMSPETITDPSQVDARSDIYSLGAVGYYLLSGQHVFDGATAVEICSQHLHDIAVPPSVKLGTTIPKALEELILACLAKNRNDRPQTAAELEEQLRSMRDIGLWDRAQAISWWREHPDARLPTAPKDLTHEDMQQPITVDLRQRA